jgi:hypothetical protein
VIDKNGYRIFRIGVPAPGRWRITLASGRAAARATVSVAAPSDLQLVARLRAGRGRRLLVTARLTKAGAPIDDAKVHASLLLPGLSVRQVQRALAAGLKKVKLPKALDEPENPALQRALVALAFLIAKDQRRNPFKRFAVDLELVRRGDGLYVAETTAKAAGDVRLNVMARGEGDGGPWQRHVQASARIPELVR